MIGRDRIAGIGRRPPKDIRCRHRAKIRLRLSGCKLELITKIIERIPCPGEEETLWSPCSQNRTACLSTERLISREAGDSPSDRSTTTPSEFFAVHAESVSQYAELVEQFFAAAVYVFGFGDEFQILVRIDVAIDQDRIRIDRADRRT